ncbi:alpha-hydroxy-acid oxidizing protein [Actinomadura sp. DC4]|uniref:alpha-hydroxy-acid oxidizing protein n=1 Tax=Actinomadura sp. DC4 TaxID=3055069 RepID=UPI00339D49BF
MDVAVSAGPWWFQAYVPRDRTRTREPVRRAAGAGAAVIVLTGGTPPPGRRPRGRDPGLAPDESLPGEPRRRRRAGRRRHLRRHRVAAGDLRAARRREGTVLRDEDARACAAARASRLWVSDHGCAAA